MKEERRWRCCTHDETSDTAGCYLCLSSHRRADREPDTGADPDGASAACPGRRRLARRTTRTSLSSRGADDAVEERVDKVCVRNLPAVAVACESEPNRSQYVAQHAARRQDPRRSSDIDPTGTHQSIDSSVSQRARIDPVGQQSIDRSVLSQRGGEGGVVRAPPG